MELNNSMLSIVKGLNIDLSKLDELKLNSELKGLIENGFDISGKTGCIYFRERNSLETDQLLENIVDLAGMECFINDISIDDYVSGLPDVLIQGILFANEISQNLEKLSSKNVKVILTMDEDAVTVRFHQIRDGQSWLDSDIDSYQEGIAVVTTSD